MRSSLTVRELADTIGIEIAVAMRFSGSKPRFPLILATTLARKVSISSGADTKLWIKKWETDAAPAVATNCF
jgi:hypothetical protein